MARDRLLSLRQVQRILSSRATRFTGFRFTTIAGADARSLPSLCDESHIVELDEEGQNQENGLQAFLKRVEEIRASLQELQEDVESVKLKHSEILASPNTANEPARNELDSLMSRIKTNTKGIRSKLKQMEDEIGKEVEDTVAAAGGHQEAENLLLGSSQHRIKKVQHSALLEQFTDSIHTYLSSQADYQDRCKEKMKRQLGVVGRHSITNDADIERLMDDQESWNIFTRGIISEPTVTKQMMVEIEERHADILKLEKSIIELHDVFIEMSILVEAQGEQIDRIENSVAVARDYIPTATKNLKKAKEYQESTRKKKIMIIGGIVAIVCILVLITILCVAI